MMIQHPNEKFGNYRLIRRIGGGGFAHVWLGEHMTMGNVAAVKILSVLLPTPQDQDKFLREGRYLASLQHPNIVRIMECGVEGVMPSIIPYIILEYAANGTLRDRHPRGSQLTPETVVGYVKQIAAGLQFVHDQRIIHCDIKPENLLLNATNNVLISDFGIAKALHTISHLFTQTLRGTLAYMAPEHMDNNPVSASDQFSLAVVVYEWLTGELPFPDTSLATIRQSRQSKPPRLRDILPGISPDLEGVVFRALSEDFRARFNNVLEFATALEQAVYPPAPVIPVVPVVQLANQPISLIPDPYNQAPGPVSPLPGFVSPVPPSFQPVSPPIASNMLPPDPLRAQPATPPPLTHNPLAQAQGKAFTSAAQPMNAYPAQPIIGPAWNNPLLGNQPAGTPPPNPPPSPVQQVGNQIILPGVTGPQPPGIAYTNTVDMRQGQTQLPNSPPYYQSQSQPTRRPALNRRFLGIDWSFRKYERNRRFLYLGGAIDLLFAIMLGLWLFFGFAPHRSTYAWYLGFCTIIFAWVTRSLCAGLPQKWAGRVLAVVLSLYWAFIILVVAGFSDTIIPTPILAIITFMVSFFFFHLPYVNKNKR